MSVHCEEEAVVEVEAPEEEEAVAAVEVSCVHMPPSGRKGREQREVGKGRGWNRRGRSSPASGEARASERSVRLGLVRQFEDARELRRPPPTSFGLSAPWLPRKAFPGAPFS